MATRAYMRVSSRAQAEALTIELQRDRLAELFEVDEWYSDEAVSGAEADRPGLGALLSDCRKGDRVVMVKLDRLARDAVLQEMFLRELWGKGVKVLSASPAESDYLDPDADTTDPSRTMIRQILAAVSQYEKNMVRMRLSAGQAAKKARGGYAHGAPPYGYEAKGKELVPLESEQRGVDMIVELRSKGFGLRAIAEALMEAGIPAKRSLKWHPRTVQLVLEHRGLS